MSRLEEIRAAWEFSHDCCDITAHDENAIPWLLAEVQRLDEALQEINDMRSNVICTQSASSSNTVYPIVAILDRAGYEPDKERSIEQMALHMCTYRGAGGTPRRPHEANPSRNEQEWQAKFREDNPNPFFKLREAAAAHRETEQ